MFRCISFDQPGKAGVRREAWLPRERNKRTPVRKPGSSCFEIAAPSSEMDPTSPHILRSGTVRRFENCTSRPVQVYVQAGRKLRLTVTGRESRESDQRARCRHSCPALRPRRIHTSRSTIREPPSVGSRHRSPWRDRRPVLAPRSAIRRVRQDRFAPQDAIRAHASAVAGSNSSSLGGAGRSSGM